MSVLERKEPADDVTTPSFYKGVNRRPSFRNPFFRVCSSGTPFIQTDRRRAPSLPVWRWATAETPRSAPEREKSSLRSSPTFARQPPKTEQQQAQEKKQMLQLASTFSSVFSLSPFLSLFKRNSFWGARSNCSYDLKRSLRKSVKVYNKLYLGTYAYLHSQLHTRHRQT